MHRCLASIYYFIRTGNRSKETSGTTEIRFFSCLWFVSRGGRSILHIKKMSGPQNEYIPPVLGMLVLGTVCIFIGLYFAFFSSGVFHLTSRPLQLSPYDVFGNLLIFAGIIILLIGSYRQKNSPVY